MYFTRDGLIAQDGDRVLDDESITTTYTFDPPMNIKILAASYTQNGEFLGIDSVLGGKIQLCSDTTTRLNAAFVFGTYYSHSVRFLRISSVTQSIIFSCFVLHYINSTCKLKTFQNCKIMDLFYSKTNKPCYIRKNPLKSFYVNHSNNTVKCNVDKLNNCMNEKILKILL